MATANTYICPVCQTSLTAKVVCPKCRFDLSQDWAPSTDKLDDPGKLILQKFAQQEQWRNTKGVAGFGCLTLYLGAGAVVGTGLVLNSLVHLSVEAVPQLFAALFLAVAAYFPLRAFRGRWTLRSYHLALAHNPPDYFPKRPSGLTDKQWSKELTRLMVFDRMAAANTVASGHIETGLVRPLPDDIRAQHVWIPGLPGYGKSTLMHWMAVEDINAGKGLTVIDPAGDLVGNGLPDDPDRHIPGLIDWVPYERIEDTIYLDLKTPVPIDFFSYANEDEKLDLAGNLVDLFNRLGEMFGGQPGVRFSGIVRDIVYTLFEAKEAGCPTSFIDIYDFIKDIDRRAQILSAVSAKTKASWDRFPNDEKTEPIISRLTPIAKNSRLRPIFGTPDAALKIADVMNERSIFLVNIGGASEAGIILGTMIISQLLQAGLRRSELPRHKRVPHHIYVDEFQNFQVGSDMAKILTQCRKYNLCLTVANQYTDQLPANTLSAVFGGTSTWFLFRLSPKDIPLFPKNLPSIQYEGVYEKQKIEEDGLADLRDSFAPDWLKDETYGKKTENVLVDLKPIPFDPKILATLQVGEAIHRKADATAEKIKTHAMGARPAASFAALIRERTMMQYGQPYRRAAAAGTESGQHDEPSPEPGPPDSEPQPSTRPFSRPGDPR